MEEKNAIQFITMKNNKKKASANANWDVRICICRMSPNQKCCQPTQFVCWMCAVSCDELFA